MTPIVLFDGDCGLCQRSVQFILDHEADHELHFAPLASPTGQRLLAAHQVTARETMVVITDDGVSVRSAGALEIARHLRRPWRWLRCCRWVPRGLRDLAYRGVARSRWLWPKASCRIPDATTRARFLDV
jgi:predicted DCC family thiol-disulfide oxidoreductase YuxK